MTNLIDDLDSIFEQAFSANLALRQGTYIFANIEQYFDNSKEVDFLYPLLWLHSESFAHDSADSGNNPHTLGLSPKFMIVLPVEEDDYVAQQQAISQTYVYVLQILRFLNRYRRATGITSPVLDKQRQINYTQILRHGPDNVYGWKIVFPIQAQINLNLNAANWDQDLLPPAFFKPG